MQNVVQKNLHFLSNYFLFLFFFFFFWFNFSTAIVHHCPNSDTMQQLSEHFAFLKFSFLQRQTKKKKKRIKLLPAQHFRMLYLARKPIAQFLTLSRCPPFCRSLSFIKTTWKKFLAVMDRRREEDCWQDRHRTGQAPYK